MISTPFGKGEGLILEELNESRRECKVRPTHGFVIFIKKFLTGRRHPSNCHWSHSLCCRLPILTLWALIVVVILYKSLGGSTILTYDSGNLDEHLEYERATSSITAKVSPEAESWILEEKKQPKIYYDVQRDNSADKDHRRPSVAAPERLADDQNRKIPTPPKTRETRKSLVSEYSRNSDIFILLIQDEELRGGTRPDRHGAPHEAFRSAKDKLPPLSPDDFGRHKINVPSHIRHLTEILSAHKVGYTIDTTRHGVPNALLSSEKRYSVIIIDNLINYTKLSRWIRDQLDRHCRAQNIGILSYLIDDQKLLTNHRDILRTSPWHHNRDENHVLQQRSAYGESSSSSSWSSDEQSRQLDPSDTRASKRFRPLEQFPIDFRISKQNCSENSTDDCLIDYQVNEKNPILRLVKRKSDFIIAGELESNLNLMPYVMMSSDHVSYEPLTWARMRRVSARARRHVGHLEKPPADQQELGRGSGANQAKGPRGTQHGHHNYAQMGVPLGRSRRAAIIVKQQEENAPTPTGSSATAPGDDPSAALGPQQSVEGDQHVDKAYGELEEEEQEEGAPQEGGGHMEQESADSENIELLQDTAAGDSRAGNQLDSGRVILSYLDRGLYDGIKRVIFGFANRHWLNRMLIIDAIEYLSAGEIQTPLDRFVQIDIDDIFVGERGTKLNRSDVESLIETQAKWSQLFEDGFKFNLGFSAKFFTRGSEEEKLGDEHLVRRAAEFNWFCHFFSHAKAHLFNDTHLLALEIQRNLRFAKENRLPLIGYTRKQLNDFHQHWSAENRTAFKMPPTYAVAPHHSGVYPIHEQLYEVWQNLLNVRVTSTEEYPHLRPVTGRKGFVYKTIKVLPRQTCGLYTHTIFKRKYPGGFRKLLRSIDGGELFQTVLHNPVNIYMTHMSNYANDRLSPFTFGRLFQFVQTNTNLRLRFAPSGQYDSLPDHAGASELVDHSRQISSSKDSVSMGKDAGQMLGPAKLADEYFSLNPAEQEPLWTNPCDDRRHLAIWSPSKHHYCNITPSILIVGPQKTGTTALYTFLKLNPLLQSSKMSPLDFEEVQFFNNKHYLKGVDWYFERFDDPSRENGAPNKSVDPLAQVIYFDKSATYFDDPKVPRRAYELLPDALIITVLINPADRAYSWYQHMRAHEDPAATRLSFEEVLSWNESATDEARFSSVSMPTELDHDTQVDHEAVISLKRRCLQPGYFASHLINWLNYYPTRQIVIVDGEWFKFNPSAVMNKLQSILRVRQTVDYGNLLVFNEHKGFHCYRDLQSSGQQVDSSFRHQSTKHQPPVKCLGPSKGRKYEPMSQEARKLLNRHYWLQNNQLAKLLYEIGQPLPGWLDEIVEG